MNPNFSGKPELKLNPVSSWEAKFADKLKSDIEAGKINKLPLNNDTEIRKIILNKFTGKHPRFSEDIVEDIIKELKKVPELFEKHPEKIKKPKIEPEHEFIEINIPEKKVSVVEDKGLADIAKINIDKEEIKKQKDFILSNKEVIDFLLEKSKKILNTNSNLEEYVKAGIFSRREVDEDLEKIKQRENEFDVKMSPDEKEVRKSATIFEAVVIDSVNLSECFGANVKAEPASRFDDIFRGTDIYLNFKNNEKEKDVALGLDVKMAGVKGELFEKKAKGILFDIEMNNMKKMKHFKDFDKNLKKNVFVPKVIIASDLSMVKELMFDFKNLNQEEFSSKLKTHRMSRELVSQVVGQCNIFKKYAEEKDRPEIAGYYGDILRTIYEIAEDSPILKRLLDGAGSDAVSQKIREIIYEYRNEKNIQPENDLDENKFSKEAA